MAKITKATKSKAKENEENVSQKITEIETPIVPEPAAEPKPAPDKSKTYKCHGLFTNVSYKEICWTYADGKYSKAFLRAKGMRCPTKSKE